MRPLTPKKPVGLSECDPKGEYPTVLQTLSYGVVVFIALRAMLVSGRSFGAEDETGACFREILGVKESINQIVQMRPSKLLF